ncbi:MAG: LysR family transcriptional regulator [Polyangiaceae bacterium]
MFDPVTLDQLRALVAVAEAGSFSGAARKLKRVQSAISTAMANLEDQLGVPIWDRSTKVPALTEQGKAVLTAARRVLAEVDGLRRLTSGMVMGLEASVSLCVDALFPLGVLVDLCAGFAKEFPTVDLRVDTQVLSAVSARVQSGAATIGVAGEHGLLPELERKVLAPIRMIPVVGPEHPLAQVRGGVSNARLRDAVQIVLSERSDSGVADQGVLSPRTWRVADLYTKHALLRANLGWGNLPEHLVREDIEKRRLLPLRLSAWGDAEHKLLLSVIYRSDTTFGPAHRWLLGRLESACMSGDSSEKPTKSRRSERR